MKTPTLSLPGEPPRPATELWNLIRHVSWLSWSSGRGLSRAVWKDLPRGWWLMPALGSGLLMLLGAGQALSLFVGKYAWTGKDFQEVLGPSFLLGAVVLSAFLWWMDRHPCRAWMICLPTALLCREIHFSGTGTGIYVALLLIGIYAVRQRRQLQPLWNCHTTCALWLGALSWYALAVTVDSGVWKFLPHSRWWSVNLEETLESGGHLAVLFGVLASVQMVSRKSISAEPRRAIAIRLQHDQATLEVIPNECC